MSGIVDAVCTTENARKAAIPATAALATQVTTFLFKKFYTNPNIKLCTADMDFLRDLKDLKRYDELEKLSPDTAKYFQVFETGLTDEKQPHLVHPLISQNLQAK